MRDLEFVKMSDSEKAVEIITDIAVSSVHIQTKLVKRARKSTHCPSDLITRLNVVKEELDHIERSLSK